MFQSPILVVVIADFFLYYVIGYSIPFPEIALPASPLKLENVIPAFFTGTVTATSILVGFFTVSAYNFRQWLEGKVGEYFDMFSESSTLYNNALEKKAELERLEKESEKEIEKKELLKEIAKKKVEIEAEIRKCGELKELAGLNRDAYAHQQEHLSTFMLNYLLVSFFLLFVQLAIFLVTPITSKLIGIFVDWTLVSLNGVFNGLIVFMFKFMTYTVHKEMT